MNVHSNAKTTPKSRALMVERVKAGDRIADVARDLGVSVRTVHKWRAREREGGEPALGDRRSTPRRSPRRTPEPVVLAIGYLRWMKLTQTGVAQALGMALSTVSAVLHRLGLARPSDVEAKAPVVRYERERPGELVHMDIKKFGRFDRVGHRIHGDHAIRSHGVGHEFLHVCVDDHTRLAYAEILSDERADSVTGFLLRMLDWFAERGVPVERILTDNGGAYRSNKMRRMCEALRIKHKFTKPYRPQTNGKAERFIQTIARGWAYGRPYNSSDERAAALDPWLHHYNHHRPHASLGRRPPIERLNASVNNLSGTHS